MFCILALLQNTFFAGMVNLVLVLVCLLAFFEEPKRYNYIYLVVFAGVLSDVFSGSFFGVSVVSLLIVYFFLKEIIRFFLNIPKKHFVVYFIVSFISSAVVYEISFRTLSLVFNQSSFFYCIRCLILGLLYNLLFALLGFLIFKLSFHGFKKLSDKRF